LANQLKSADLVYRDIFGILQTSETDWTYQMKKVLRDLLIVLFLYETGARAGELANLGSKKVNETVKERGDVYLITVEGKTREREHYFTKYTAELWRLWCKIRPDACRAFENNFGF